MALIKCPECGQNISDQATACIHCGFPLHQTIQSSADNTTKTTYSVTLIDIPDILSFSRNIERVFAMLGMTKKEFKETCKQKPCILKKGLSQQECEQLAEFLRTCGMKVSTDVPDSVATFKDAYAIVVTKIRGMMLMPIANVLAEFNKSEPRTIMSYLNNLPAVLLNHLAYDEAVQVLMSNKSDAVELNIMRETETKGMALIPKCSDGVADASGAVRCPRCGSTAVTTGQRGYKLSTGFLGSNKTMNRCAKCGHKWMPSKWG